MLNHVSKPSLFYTGLAFSIVFLGFWITKAYFFLPHDFANSYFAGLFFARGEFDIGIFDPYTFNKKIFDAGFNNVFASYNPNPPSTALFFSVLSLLSLPTAKLVFNVVTSALFLISIYRLCKHVGVDPSLIFLVLPLVFFIPLRNQILFGQTYFLLIFLLIEGFIAYEKKRLWLAGALWSVAIFLKIFPLLIVLFLLIKKEWRMIGYLAAGGAIILLTCFAAQGIELWSYYLFEVLPRSNSGEVTTAYEANFQSAQMFLKYLFVGDTQLNPSPLIDNIYIYQWGLVALKALALAVFISFITKAKSSIGFGMIFLTAILVLSYGNTYGNLVLLVLLIAVWKEVSARQLIALGCIIFLISNVPLGLLSELPAVLRFPRLLLLVVLFVSVVAFMRVKPQWKYLLILLPVVAMPTLLQKKGPADTSLLLAPEQKHSLVFDYEVETDALVYHYWTDQGKQTFKTELKLNQQADSEVELKGNQIFYKGKQVTFGSDNKRSPVILNESLLVYMSDKDRGLGFYSLRVVHINQLYQLNPPS